MYVRFVVAKRHPDTGVQTGIFEAHGIGTEMLMTDRPGFVVYEDRHQVLVEPFWSELS
jgi:hypothetical protein